MKIIEALGIDVSKSTIDVHLHQKNMSKEFENSNKGFKQLVKWGCKQTKLCFSQIVVCFEHTGLYSLQLAAFFQSEQIDFVMVPALEIKRSFGIVRGKSDRVDAQRIANYAYLRRDDLTPTILPSKKILAIQKLLGLRAKLVIQRAGFKSLEKESKSVLSQKENSSFFSTQKKMITYLTKQINALEKEIKSIITNDSNLDRLFKLVTSVKGIGLIVAVNMLVITNCFTNFQDGRKFACYAGIAPFQRQSGTSLKSTARVSHLANKHMKALLHLAAGSAIQSDPEMQQYYLKRVEKGNSKMRGQRQFVGIRRIVSPT